MQIWLQFSDVNFVQKNTKTGGLTDPKAGFFGGPGASSNVFVSKETGEMHRLTISQRPGDKSWTDDVIIPMKISKEYNFYS